MLLPYENVTQQQQYIFIIIFILVKSYSRSTNDILLFLVSTFTPAKYINIYQLTDIGIIIFFNNNNYSVAYNIASNINFLLTELFIFHERIHSYLFSLLYRITTTFTHNIITLSSLWSASFYVSDMQSFYKKSSRSEATFFVMRGIIVVASHSHIAHTRTWHYILFMFMFRHLYVTWILILWSEQIQTKATNLSICMDDKNWEEWAFSQLLFVLMHLER